MAYWEIVARSFRIAWRFKYLWLLALFAGEAGGGFNFNYSFNQPIGRGTTVPSLPEIAGRVTDWVGAHAGLLIVLGAIWIVLAIAFFVLAAACQGAVVRAAAEHDAERPFGLAQAWRCGVSTIGPMIRFRLLVFALYLPVIILLAALGTGFVVAIVNQNPGAAVALGIALLLLFLIAIPYAIYLSFLDRLGTRAVALELVKAGPALVRAHRLLVRRPGRVLLVWLLSIAVGLGLAVCTSIVLAVLAVPAFIVGFAVYASGSSAFWLVAALSVLVIVPVALIVSAFVVAQSSSYWTLAFRRLEIDQAAPGFAYAQTAPPQVTG